jgi:hypothetical protein
VVVHAKDVSHLLRVQGVVKRIDLVDRSMVVALEKSQKLFILSTACVIWLNGERVKLRMLQSGDGVRVFYREAPAGPVALVLDARTRAALPARTG